MHARQLSLLGARPPSFDRAFARARRLGLGRGAWLDHAPGWLAGHDTLFDALSAGAGWRSEQRWMYERLVETPRLLARIPLEGSDPEAQPLPHPLLLELSAVLSTRYGRPLDRVTLALYRDGRDSVAWHGDRIGRVRRDTVVAIVSLGAPRRFLIRPAPPRSGAEDPALPRSPAGERRSLRFHLGGGDLLVMGGTCQRTFEHAIPKVADAGPRISVMFREAPPEEG